MGIPLVGVHMAELLKIYRDAWTAAGHGGRGRVMLAFHMFCAETREKAAAIAREPLNIYLKSIVNAASDWMSGVSSADYPNYQKMIEIISRETFELQIEKGAAWIGAPDDIRKAVAAYHAEVGGFESASLQVNFGMIPQQEAEELITLFAREVMPYFKSALTEGRHPMSATATIAAVAAPATGLSGRDIPTLPVLYEAAGALNFTPGWVPRKKPILWSEPRPDFWSGALDLRGRQGRARRGGPADRRLARRAPQPGDA